MSDKTLVMKLLEGKRIPYTVIRYPDTIRDAEMIAATLNLAAGQIFKTLVVPAPPRRNLLALIPADRQLDLKKLAKIAGAKKLKMATQREAESLTGLQVGGISPLALLNRGFTVYIDEAAANFEAIYVSAGQRGLNVLVGVEPLAKLTRARLIAITS